MYTLLSIYIILSFDNYALCFRYISKAKNIESCSEKGRDVKKKG